MAATTIKSQAYTVLNDNGWLVHKYNDGYFEAWYLLTTTKTATATNQIAGFYRTGQQSIPMPSITRTTLHYNVNASFTTKYSFPIFWAMGTNLFYMILADSSSSSEIPYRFSAYMFGGY